MQDSNGFTYSTNVSNTNVTTDYTVPSTNIAADFGNNCYTVTSTITNFTNRSILLGGGGLSDQQNGNPGKHAIEITNSITTL
jgi:hypothetical protein